MRTSITVLSLLALSASVPVCAADAPAGAPFLLNPVSVRQAGMAGIALGGSDVLRAWSNPALLTGLVERGEVGASTGAVAGGIQTVGGVGAAYRITGAIAAGGYYGFESASFKGVDAFGDETGTNNETSSFAGGLAGAYKWRMLSGGVTLKAVKDTVDGAGSLAMAADFGMTAEWRGFTGAFSVLNMGGALREADDFYPGGVVLPLEIRAGVSYLYEPLALSGAVEFRKSTERDSLVGLGVDWWAVKWFALRTGLVAPLGDDDVSLTGGLTALWRDFGFDYGLVTQPVGLTHKVAVSWYYGRGWTPPAAPVQAPAAEEKPQAAPLNVAVADLSPQGVSASDAAMVTDMIRNTLVNKGGFNVVEKANMDRILAEQAFQQSGCTSEECAVKIGKLLNVNRMVMGSFGKLLTRYVVNVRVVNVEDGKIMFSDEAMGDNVDRLMGETKKMTERLAKNIK